MPCHALDITWNPDRWPNFSPLELACHCCGELPMLTEDFDALQEVRRILRRPVIIHSGHRCPLHNARVGGAPLSQHKRIAFDIGTANQDRAELLEACRRAGFTGFGYYQTFLHVDRGRPRRWWTKGGLEAWNGLIF